MKMISFGLRSVIGFLIPITKTIVDTGIAPDEVQPFKEARKIIGKQIKRIKREYSLREKGGVSDIVIPELYKKTNATKED